MKIDKKNRTPRTYMEPLKKKKKKNHEIVEHPKTQAFEGPIKPCVVVR